MTDKTIKISLSSQLSFQNRVRCIERRNNAIAALRMLIDYATAAHDKLASERDKEPSETVYNPAILRGTGSDYLWMKQAFGLYEESLRAWEIAHDGKIMIDLLREKGELPGGDRE